MELPQNTIIASGPVIIENGKVLLNREKKDWGITPWFFPGGKFKDSDGTFENTCIRETKEEMGIDVQIIRPLRTLLMKKPEGDGMVILVHYLAKRIGDVQPAENIAEWDWHDINTLPENSAPNVVEIINDYRKENNV